MQALAAAAPGEVFVAPFDVLLSRHDVVEPDLLFVSADQLDIVTDQHVRGAGALHHQSRGMAEIGQETEVAGKRVLYPRAALARDLIVTELTASPLRKLGAILAQGAMVSFTGIVTFKNSQTVRDSAVALRTLGKSLSASV